MIEAVVFDLDDTLAPEKSFVKSGYRVIADELNKKYGLNAEYAFERLMSLFSQSSKNVFNRLLDAEGISYEKEDIMSLVRKFREHEPDGSVYRFYDDVEECLRQLELKGISRGILSDGFLISQKNKIEALGGNRFFNYVLLTDELGREFWKPNALGFEKVMRKLNVTPDKMMYVGDNPNKDFYIKKSIPEITTVRIIRENGVYSEAEYLENIKEDYRINSLAELVGIL